eukprot:scaffold4244_cov167-Amphora_coffeaeformis.AAC.35
MNNLEVWYGTTIHLRFNFKACHKTTINKKQHECRATSCVRRDRKKREHILSESATRFVSYNFGDDGNEKQRGHDNDG